LNFIYPSGTLLLPYIKGLNLLGAIASERAVIEQLGSELDKKEKECKIDVKTQDYYYRIIDEAQRLEETT
jgi:hypothetical protein